MSRRGTSTTQAIVRFPTLEEAAAKRDQLPPQGQEHLDQTVGFRHRERSIAREPGLLEGLHRDIQVAKSSCRVARI